MPELDVRGQIESYLETMLPPPERVRATERVALTGGSDERDDRELTDRLRLALERRSTTVPSIAAGAAGSAQKSGFALVSPFDGPGGDVEAQLNGVAIAGPRDAIASQWDVALRAHRDTFATVTDQRMLLLADRHHAARARALREGAEVPPFEVIGEVGPGRLRYARRTGVLFNRGRLELYFSDGSMLALFVVPQFAAARADLLLRALGG